jgi:hypothetical protein
MPRRQGRLGRRNSLRIREGTLVQGLILRAEVGLFYVELAAGCVLAMPGGLARGRG